MTEQRIKEWVEYYGEENVYISFSGGKDSTVLLDITRRIYPDISAVFVDTGMEYPEIRNFVKTFDNVEFVKPDINFRQVIEKYGYPFITKEVSRKVYECRSTERRGKESYARRQFQGTYVSKNGKRNIYSVRKWEFLTEAPFEISHKCCDVMKKNPSKKYEKLTGKHAILGQMAEESFLRKQLWVRDGCNAFDKKRPTSNPMSFWTEQDVLRYIYEHELPIASVYGSIVENNGIFSTSGCDRTGCVYCGFGCHKQKRPNKFEIISEVSNPNLVDYIMRGGCFNENGSWVPSTDGLGYWFVMKWINIHGGLDMYIPNCDEYEEKYGNDMTRNYLYELAD